MGKLREADSGTLVLKNIGALPLLLQHRLLEVLAETQARPVGASAPVAIDVRIVSIASDQVEPLIAQGKFSHMLYQRLHSVAIAVPPLRDRRSDIPLLARHFIGMYAAMENKSLYGLTDRALEYLACGAWPGNVRQLSSLLWRAVILCNQELLDTADIRVIPQLQPMQYDFSQDNVMASVSPLLLDMQGRMKKLKSIEEEVIRFALSYSNGCMTRAARSLGIGRSTLYRRVNELMMEGYIPRANQTTRPMMKVSSAERS
jgi:DNA-binding NtrC family response regulator